ncbi:MAG: serine dehydratase subunit alpha family protein [Desulfonatronovibrionaceae bacterium]
MNIPGTGGLNGLELASALGCVAGDPGKKMQVLEGLKDEDVQRAVEMVGSGRVEANLDQDKQGLYVKTVVRARGNEYTSIIRSQHEHITGLYVNREEVSNPFFNQSVSQGPYFGVGELEKELQALSLDKALEISLGLDEEDMVFIEKGIEMNMRLARWGLENDCGLRVGKRLKELEDSWINSDPVHESRVYTSAAADARMFGAPLPAMSSAGSGNHGLTAIIPVKIIADRIKCSRQDLCRAVALSHVITACVKSHTGRLAAICACSVASGAGAAAAVAWLLGGAPEQIEAAINNIIEDLAGVICDGAKNSCALKLATASGNAVTAALLALKGAGVQSTDGIVGQGAMQTIANIGRLSSQGMVEADRIILQIMLDKIKDYK